MNITLVKTGDSTFVIPYKEDIEIAKQFKMGKMYKVKISADRNSKHHRKFFAILRLVVNNSKDFQNTDMLLSWLKIKAGITYTVKIGGDICLFPKSISFDKMNQIEFKKFYNRSLDILAEYLKISVDDIEQNSWDYL